MESINVLTKKIVRTLKEEGLVKVALKSKDYMRIEKERKMYSGKVFKDVLFINGVNYKELPHPPRYRIQHQMEQLRANNIESDEVFYPYLDLEFVRNYRVFIFFRCPYTDEIGRFIKLAKELNKVILYDIDDLVIDTKYTDTIKYLETMDREERDAYDRHVCSMQSVLRMCDAVITTTERLEEELRHYCPQVFINRNTASEKMLSLSEKAYQKTRNSKATGKVKLGYFSGSITHNDDFIFILPAIERIMREYSCTELHIVGILDIPKELKEFEGRIIAHPFVEWEDLPQLIASVDINLAPLETSIFNEAKSENKWVEAALVRVVTVASNVGAFQKMIKADKTGILCNSTEEWYEQLKRLITDEKKRTEIANAAYEYCHNHCVTLYTGFPLAHFIKEMCVPNIVFIFPSLNISGGIMVALEHCKVLRGAGYDVTVISESEDNQKWCDFRGIRFPVLSKKEYSFYGSFDKAVATMWTTVKFLEGYPNISQRYYLVQNFETDFYEANHPSRIEANQSYLPHGKITFLTISKWCEAWLKEKFCQEARYLQNGIHAENFKPVKRSFDGKIRILIEGDCQSYYKNVDESFEITNQLDRECFEVWYMSYNAEPKEWYKVEKFLHKIPYEEVAGVYQQCHILLKTSFLESFSYPPLEMMATGGFAVVVPNDGNREYLSDGENCLLYPKGEIKQGLQAIYRICEDEELREKLYYNGIETARERDWENIAENILFFYDCKSVERREK